MRRLIVCLLVVSILLSCIISVSATSYDTGFNNYFNLLDFDTHDGDNISQSDSSLIAYFNYSMPVQSIATYVDVVISTASGAITSAYGGRPGITPGETGSLELNVERITSRLFRVYGQIPQYSYTEIQLSLFTSASNTICTAQSFYVWNDRIDLFEETGTLIVSDYDVNNARYVQETYGAICNHGMASQAGTSAQGLAIATFYVPNWIKYDFVQLYGSAYSSNITSVAARYNNLGVPYTINFLSGSVSDSLDSASSRRDFIITLDLRGLDRSIATDLIMPDVTLQLPYSLAQGGSVALYRVHGIIQLDTFDTENYFFKHILDELKLFRTNFFNVLASLQTNLATWFTDLGNYLGGLLVTLNNNMNAGFTNIATKFNTLLTNLGTWFEDVQTSISTQTTALKNALTTHFNNLQTWISDFKADVAQKFSILFSSLQTYFQSLYMWIVEQTNDIIGSLSIFQSAIEMKLIQILDGTFDQNKNADDFNSDVEDQDSQLDDMTDVMDSVERPDLNDVDISTDGMISINVLNASTKGLGLVLGNEIILRLLIMALTFALAGFILYGKR